MRAQPHLFVDAVAKILPVAILVGLLTASYFGLPRLELCVVGLLFVNLLFLKHNETHMHALDWSVLLIVAVELLSFMFSQYQANSIRTAVAVTLAAATFFAVRIAIRTKQQMALLCLALTLGGLCIALSTIHQFAESASVLRGVGLHNLLAFRSQLVLAPSRWVTGEWFTLLMLTLPFACALQFLSSPLAWATPFSLIPALVISAALMLSLSRSIFWSTIIFCFSACGLMAFSHVFSLRTSLAILAISLLILLIILLCESALYPSIFRSYDSQQTSQIRSTYGRLAIWHQSIRLFLEHPIWGVGSSNAGLELTSLQDPESIGAITNTFSFPLEILVEKGAVGFLAYVAFLTTLSRKAFVILRPQSCTRSRFTQSRTRTGNNFPPRKETSGPLHLASPKALICCFGAGLIALSSRELVYASVLQHASTVIMVAILSALACAEVNT